MAKDKSTCNRKCFHNEFLENPIVPKPRFKHETYKVIGTECCSYLLDNTGNAVSNLAKVLHEQVSKLDWGLCLDQYWINIRATLESFKCFS